ncbi:MAG: replication-associated recombination protein A [Candidatus Erginobacter occultus]|nr:replication-associated recombination protein A [Candidatus Erginobacter occultus]
MDLFSEETGRPQEENAPLAYRMRPRSLEDILGQDELLGPGKILRRLIEEDRIRSAIIFGPPGTGKTSLVRIIGASTSSHFATLSAVDSNVARVKEVIGGAKNRRANTGRGTLLFVDEFHRFNRAQQEVLLPHIEDGTISFLGLTTLNPFHALAPALLSRSQLFRFQPLTPVDLKGILRSALSDRERGLGGRGILLEEAALDFLAAFSEGDGRRGLNTLETAAAIALPDASGKTVISREAAARAAQQKIIASDRAGDEHYDTISAFIKSVRGSDPDAALYWLARMLKGGQDPRFLARRLVILAAEDIGNADPHALTFALSAARAVEYVGMPEGQLILAQAATYLASAPKSNAAYRGLKLALEDIEKEPLQSVPEHLKNRPDPGAQAGIESRRYLYPHDYPGGWVEQAYLAVRKRYYVPTGRGYEAAIGKRLRTLNRRDREESEAGKIK